MVIEALGRFCQSCGMPLVGSEDFGTNADGSSNMEYCGFCYLGGGFIEPDIRVDQMVDLVTGMWNQTMGVPEPDAREAAEGFIPALRRWQAT